MAEYKLKNRIIVEDKFVGIKDIVDAIDVENYVVTVPDYAKLSQVLYRVIMAGASAPVLLTADAVPHQNGFDLFQQLLIEYGRSSSARTVADLSTLKMTYLEAVKIEPDITVGGFVNKLVKARLALGSIDDAVFRSFLISSFEGSVMNGYIKQVKNTDGISAKTIVQGLIDRSAELEQKAKATKAEKALAKVNMAIKHIEQCQLCGKKNHQARQCTGLSRSMRESIRAALDVPATARRADPKCTQCGQYGHTTARCRQLQQCFSCGKTGHFKDQCPERTAAPAKPPAGYSCTKCKATADHYSEDCQAMTDVQAKIKLTHADIAAVAAEMGMQYELGQPMAGWEDGPIRGV